MVTTKRMIFSFDEKSLDGLKALQKHFGAKSMAETVRMSLQLADLIRKQVDAGYREVLVRNPRSGRNKVLVGELVGSGSGGE